MKLPDNTTDRLLAVADIIEFTPKRWDQSTWFEDHVDDHGYPDRVFGIGWADEEDVDCGTAGCVAGWAVALSPADIALRFDWYAAGSIALGLTRELADALFDGCLHARLTAEEMADLLRRLAKIPGDTRSVEDAAEVLTDAQRYALLTMKGTDCEDDDD